MRCGRLFRSDDLGRLDTADKAAFLALGHDHSLTEQSESAYQEWLRRTDPVTAAKVSPPHYVQTPAEAMLTALAELRERHGSVLSYLLRAGLPESHVQRLRRRAHGLRSPRSGVAPVAVISILGNYNPVDM